LQQTFADLGAAQCGYCTPGFLLVAEELLKNTPNPSRAEIQEALSGNLCRCTGYLKIYEAVELAAVQMREKESSRKGAKSPRGIETLR
jgi:carbon-monoxide dehydrogenase small subunit